MLTFICELSNNLKHLNK